MSKTYFVTADVHGFYTEMQNALADQGFDARDPEHILIVLGDLFDRGREALAMEEFAVGMMKAERLIFIRGNHEDLMLDMIRNWNYDLATVLSGWSRHNHNGTFDTALQLTEMTIIDVLNDPIGFINKLRSTRFVAYLIPRSIDYLETQKHIFVHGWIPCKTVRAGNTSARRYDPDWRNASEAEWNEARWANGMQDAVQCNIVEPGKTILCGHWNASYGHYHYGEATEIFGPGAIYTPFFHDGIIALDATTPASGFVNCIKIPESEM